MLCLNDLDCQYVLNFRTKIIFLSSTAVKTILASEELGF